MKRRQVVNAVSDLHLVTMYLLQFTGDYLWNASQIRLFHVLLLFIETFLYKVFNVLKKDKCLALIYRAEQQEYTFFYF